MKVYCVFSIIMVLVYLEFIFSFEYFLNFESLDLIVKVKILHLKTFTIKVFIENDEENKFLCIKYGIFKSFRLKFKYKSEKDRFSIIGLIKIFFRHKRSEIELVSSGEYDVINNVYLVVSAYLSKVFLTQSNISIDVKFDEENKICGVSHFVFSLEYAVYKILVMIKSFLKNVRNSMVKEVG